MIGAFGSDGQRIFATAAERVAPYPEIRCIIIVKYIIVIDEFFTDKFFAV